MDISGGCGRHTLNPDFTLGGDTGFCPAVSTVRRRPALHFGALRRWGGTDEAILLSKFTRQIRCRPVNHGFQKGPDRKARERLSTDPSTLQHSKALNAFGSMASEGFPKETWTTCSMVCKVRQHWTRLCSVFESGTGVDWRRFKPTVASYKATVHAAGNSLSN